MTKISKIGLAELRIVSTRVIEALKTLETELGVTFTTEKGKYSNAERGSFTLSFACDSASGEAQSADEIQFKRLARQFGLQPEDYRAKFRYKGEVYEIVGLRPRAPTYPITARKVSDPTKRVSFPEETITALLAQTRAVRAA